MYDCHQESTRWHDGAYNATSGYYIYFPEPAYCDTDVYTEHLGYFEIKTPEGLSTSAAEIPTEINLTEGLAIKSDLSLETINSIAIGDSVEEMYIVLGKEHGYQGSGYVGLKYILTSGETIVIYTRLGKVEQIRSLDKDGKVTILAE